MPHQFTLNSLPAGVAMHSANKGDTVEVRYCGLVTSQDGVLLTDRLEGFFDAMLGHIPGGAEMPRSSIDHILVVIRRDKQVTLYLNELRFVATVRKERGRSFKVGEPISINDGLEIEAVRAEGICVPNDAGVLVMLSHRWRRAMFYDFGPLHPGFPVVREYDFERQLGQIFGELVFQDWLRITDGAWHELLRQKWFPFRALPLSTTRKIVAFASEGKNVDELLDEISKGTREVAETMLRTLEQEPVLNDHRQSIETGLERYLAGDYVSAIHVLFARLEGVLRTLHIMRTSDGRFRQTDLTKTSMGASERERCRRSPLQPLRFMKYLESVFFAGFDPMANQREASRNSVTHGVVSEDQLSLKTATLSVLILRQLLDSATG